MRLPTATTSKPADRAAPDKPLFGPVRAAWALYQLALRQHRHGRRWLVMLVLALLPILIAVITHLTETAIPARSLEFNLVFMLIPQGLLPLLALVYASGVIQDEQEDQTITYLLVRPIPKWLIYLMKWAAAVTAAECLAVTSIVLTYATIYGDHHSAVSIHDIIYRCAGTCGVQALAVLAYCGIFGLMGIVTRRVLVVGILYTALFEGLFANIPFNLRIITVIYYARLMLYRLMSFRVNTGYRVHDLAAQAWNFTPSPHHHLTGYPPDWVCAAVLFSLSVILSAVAAFVCNRREFYVKTPSKTD
jgi:ABC-2 type transport system permease protein